MAKILAEVMFNDPKISGAEGFKSEGYFHIWLKYSIDEQQFAQALIQRREGGTMVYVDATELKFQGHKVRAYETL